MAVDGKLIRVRKGLQMISDSDKVALQTDRKGLLDAAWSTFDEIDRRVMSQSLESKRCALTDENVNMARAHLV